MNYSTVFLITAFNLFTFLVANAQSFEYRSSKEITDFNERGIFYQGLITETKESLYLLGNKTYSSSSLDQLTILKYDKTEMEITAIKEVIPKEKEKDFKDFSIVDYYELGEKIVFILEKKSERKQKGEYDFFWMSVDLELKKISKPKLFYSYNFRDEVVLFKYRPNEGGVLLLKEKFVEIDQEVRVDYIVFDNEMEQSSQGQISSGIINKSKYHSSSLVAKNFSFNNTGDHLLSLKHVPSSEELDANVHLLLTRVDLSTKETSFLELSLDNAAVSDGRYFYNPQNPSEIYITGFYTDPPEIKKVGIAKASREINTDIKGTFIFKVDLAKNEIIETVQAPLDANVIAVVKSSNPYYAKLSQKDNKRSKEALADKDAISGNYDIEAAVFTNKTARIYTQYKVNTTFRSCDANGNNCSVTYTSSRGNIFFFEIDLETGNVNWYNTIRATKAFIMSSSSNVFYHKTLKVIPSPTSDLILFNSYRIYDPNDPKDLTGKSAINDYSRFDFLTGKINNTNGQAEITLPESMSEEVDPIERLILRNMVSSNFDDQTYFFVSTETKTKIISRIPGLHFFIAFTKTRNLDETQRLIISELKIKD